VEDSLSSRSKSRSRSRSRSRYRSPSHTRQNHSRSPRRVSRSRSRSPYRPLSSIGSLPPLPRFNPAPLNQTPSNMSRHHPDDPKEEGEA
jgi:hypothetical protein